MTRVDFGVKNRLKTRRGTLRAHALAYGVRISQVHNRTCTLFRGRTALALRPTAMALRVALAIIALGFSSFFISSDAEAKYAICNKTSYVLRSAIGMEEGGGWVSRGWWTVLPGKCATILKEPLTQGTYYAYAESLTGHKGGIKYFSGDQSFCVAQDNFEIGGDRDCAEASARKGRFLKVDVGEQKNWTTTFSESTKFTQKKAEIAGTQRLLADIGFDPGRIDGELGGKTQRAIIAFKKKHGLSLGGIVTEELVTALANVATQAAEARGYEFCNSTTEKIWAAIGFEDKKKWRSRGWWVLDPGSCSKVIKDALRAEAYYIYAVVEREEGESEVVRGEHDLCTAEVKFDIKGRTDCDLRGFSSQKFLKVETRGATSWTYEFRGR